MEIPVTTQFMIYGLNPEKGRIVINKIHFRFSLTGALLMDLLFNGEISLKNNRLIPNLRKTGDPVHDMVAEKIERSSRPRRISFWLRSLSRKRRFVFREIINSMISTGLLRLETHRFLNIFPYNRYFLTDSRIRSGIVDDLRNVLLQGKPATTKQAMLIGLIFASRSHRLLAKEKGESRILRVRCRDFKQNDPMASEIDKTIREIQAAIFASTIAASAAASGSH
jgi:hypothetical protein